jgi:hypothetical protein
VPRNGNRGAGADAVGDATYIATFAGRRSGRLMNSNRVALSTLDGAEVDGWRSRWRPPVAGDIRAT